MLKEKTIDEIKRQANIYDVVSDYVDLKKTGSNYKGYCPVHSEKEPSFFVNVSMNICKCFGCGFTADAIGFLMEIEDIGYIEAIKLLADKYGISLEENNENEDLYSLNKRITMFFHKQLLKSPKLLNYLIKERGISEEIIKDFYIGYAPSYDYLKGMDKKSLIDLGLYVQKKDKVFKRFSKRIMFPIRDEYGRFIGFNSRRLAGKDSPKYLNTNNTKIFKKGKSLYGIYKAKKNIRENNKAYIVEGNLDVLRLFQVGIRGAISPNGTAVTRLQARKLRKYVKTVTLVFDGDLAGNEAAFRSGFVFLKENLQVNIVPLPKDNDPDDYFNKKKQFLEYEMSNSMSFIEYWFSHKNIKTIQDKYNLINKTKRELKGTNPILKEIIANEISDKLKINKDVILSEFKPKYTYKKDNIKSSLQKELALLGNIAKNNIEGIPDCKYFTTKETRLICKLLINKDNDIDNFSYLDSKIASKYIKMLHTYSEQYKDTKKLLSFLHNRYKKRKLKYLNKLLDKAERDNNEEKVEKLFKAIIKLKNT